MSRHILLNILIDLEQVQLQENRQEKLRRTPFFLFYEDIFRKEAMLVSMNFKLAQGSMIDNGVQNNTNHNGLHKHVDIVMLSLSLKIIKLLCSFILHFLEILFLYPFGLFSIFECFSTFVR